MFGTMHGLAGMFDISQPQAIFVVLLSFLIPLSIFVGRRNVRIKRLRVLDNLGAALTPSAGKGTLPPGFDLVRARYADHAGGLAQAAAHVREVAIYVLPTLIFVLLSACGFALLVGLADKWPVAGSLLMRGLAPDKNAVAFAAATGLVVGAGFVGAYIWSINYLILRVANFDLTPLSFLSAAAHILMTVFVAWVLRQVVAFPPAEAIPVAILLGIAFLSGIYPSLGLNVLVDRLPSWLRLKRDVEQAGQIGRAFPLDLVDGIDATIKFRLNGLDIAEVQNLATANPVELFVETPYSFAQVIDWMSQAQLLTELGPERYLKAREAGIRDMTTLLDLGQHRSGLSLLRPLFAADEPDEAFRARLVSLAGKLHVRQLRHWAGLLSQALGLAQAANLNIGQTIMPEAAE